MYLWMFYIGIICTIVFFVLSIVLFFRNDVAKRIGDLTGQNAKKNRKKLIEEVERKVKDIRKKVEQTELLSTAVLEEDTPTDVLDEVTEPLLATTKLIDHDKSGLDDADEVTDVLFGEDDEVTAKLLSEGDETTDVLRPQNAVGNRDESTILTSEEIPIPDIFQVEDEAMVVHTEERI